MKKLNKKQKFLLMTISAIIFAVGIVYTVNGVIIGWQMAVDKTSNFFFPQVMVAELSYSSKPKQVLTKEQIEEKIVFYAEVFGVSSEDALRIARCESGLNHKAENINGSATGVFQFIRKTWKNNCKGDVYNADANIICFMQNYPAHKEWWECK